MEQLTRASKSHRWKFSYIGKTLQVDIQSEADLRHLRSLDPKLWTALSCPVNGLEIDPKTLALIDRDQDGRVRLEEVLDAVEWMVQRMKSVDSIFAGGPLPLDAVSGGGPEGEALVASARKISEHTGGQDSSSLSVEQTTAFDSALSQARFNGDGIVPRSALEKELYPTFDMILSAKDPVMDRGGEPGLNAAIISEFFDELRGFETWWSQGESESGEGEEIFPLGADTSAAFAAMEAVEHKIEDYFGRGRLVAYDERAGDALNREAGIYEKVAAEDFSVSRSEIASLPIARVTPLGHLPLLDGVNPEWSARLNDFRDKVVLPLKQGDGTSLSPEDWNSIKQVFAPLRKWNESRPDSKVGALGIEKVRTLLQSDHQDRLQKAVSDDFALAGELKAVGEVQKMARFHRDLIRLLRNFVNFRDFYEGKCEAVFQAGQLFLDGKEFRLCIRVGDPARHAILAPSSRGYVIYCECRRKDAPGSFSIAAVATAGDSANLRVGRNGVFRDSRGRLWDATVTRLVENPISIRAAFFEPYIRVGRFVSDQIEKWANSKDDAARERLESGMQKMSPASGGTPAKGGLGQIGGIAALMAAGGIALGAVGAGLSAVFETFSEMPFWEVPLVFFGIILLISLPSMFIAWMKLRKRTLAPLLDAAGWAVNGRTLISFASGRRLTRRAALPAGAMVELGGKSSVRTWLLVLLGMTIVASILGWTMILY